MKRFIFWLLICVAVFGLFFIGLNLFDSRPGQPVAEPFSLAAHLEPANGFFLLWGFAEPAETDPAAPAFRARLLELFNASGKSHFFRSRYGQWLARLNAAFRQNWQGNSLNFPRLPGEDVCVFAAANRGRINEQQLRYAVPLQRYQQVLQAASLEDFTPLGWEFPSRNIALAVYTAKLFAVSRALAAMDGDWEKAETELSAGLDAGLQLVGSGRTLAVNSLGKTMIELSLRTLASLLNRSDCPSGVAQRVLESLPDRPTRAFGTATARACAWMSFSNALERIEKDKVVDPYMLKDYFREPAGFFALERFVAISGPRFFGIVHALAAFFLKKNETVIALRSFWEDVGRLEETPPASWRSGAHPAARLGAGLKLSPLWWLRNPLGKMMVSSAVPFTWPVLQHYVYRSHGLKARYDLTRLLSQARLQAGPDMSLSQASMLDLLAAATERDPFSGKPYLLNPVSGMLYSVGQDGLDNSGREQPASWRDSDIAVQVRFAISD
jgi:hypothetical protein